VNSVSRKPRWTDSGSLALQVGRYDANRAELDFNRVILGGKAAFRLVGSREDSHHIADANFKQQTLAMPMFTFRLRPGTDLTLQTLVFNFTGGAYGGLPVDLHVGTNDKAVLLRGVPRSLDIYTRDARRHTSGHITRALFTSVVNERLSARLATSLHHFNEDNPGPAFALVGPLPVRRNEQTGNFVWDGVTRNDNPVFNVGGNDGYDTRRKIEVQNDYVYQTKIGGVDSMTLAGFTYAQTRDRFWNNAYSHPPITIKSFVYVPPTRNGVRISASRTDLKNTSVYLSETLSFMNGALKVNAGVARVQYDRKARDTFGTAGTKAIKPKETIPATGVVFRPIPGLSLFAGYSEQSTPSFVSPFFAPSPGQETQSSKQWEVGARVQLLDQRLYASLSYYDIEQNNFSVPNPANAAVPTPVPLFPPLLSDRLAHGLELEVTYVITKNLSVVGNATTLRNRDKDNVPFRGTPENSAAVWFSYTADKDGALKGWSAGLGADYLAKRPGDLAQAFTSLSTPTRIIRQQPSFYLPERTLVNANIGYRYDKHWRVQLNLDNLLDEEHLQASTARATVFPGAPFNPKLRVTYSF
jgi:iron complex outermembrane receptor protein